ncbi:MAG: hypothetical protein PHG02_00345 [Oscillospiraceae bacterium]|nr:hypothetical protein [Oscillospiraceae bacterium]
MIKTWGEVKNDIIALGFEQATAYSANTALFLAGVNHAQSYLVQKLPIEKPLLLTGTGSAKSVDLAALTAVQDTVRFARAALRPAYYSGTGKVVQGLRLQGSLLYIPATVQGDFTLWYEEIPLKITADTPDDYPLEPDYYAACILPKLAAYYIWRDDDPQKATEYQNLAEGEILELLARRQTDCVSGGRVSCVLQG